MGPFFKIYSSSLLYPLLECIRDLFTKTIKTMLTRFSQSAGEENSKESEIRDSDVFWSTEPWTCTKQLKHYPAFSWRDTSIKVHSFVWVLNEHKEDSVGYIEDIFEDSNGNKMVKVRYFLFPEEIDRHLPGLAHEPRELFITPSLHKVRANLIDGLASVLNQDHFAKSQKYLPKTSAEKAFLSYREYKNGAVGPFSLSDLKGYSLQPILSFMEHYEGVEEKNPERRLEGISPSENPPRKPSFPLPNDDVEVLCQQSSLRGCWLRCKVLLGSSTGEEIKVESYDIKNHDKPSEKLEVWIPVRAAEKDTLGIRLEGRPTVRPWPQFEPFEFDFEVGRAVDVWWQNGWWEGFVVGPGPSGNQLVRVYLPWENFYLEAEKKDLRVSKEWSSQGEWWSFEVKRDVLSLIPPSPPRLSLNLSL